MTSSTTNNNYIKVDNTSFFIKIHCISMRKQFPSILYKNSICNMISFKSIVVSIFSIIKMKYNTIYYQPKVWLHPHQLYFLPPPKKNKPHICKSINKSSSWTLQNALKHSKARIKLHTCNFTWNFKVALLFETLLITASSGSLWLLNLTSCQSDFHVSVWVDRWEDIFTLISFKSIWPIFRSPC